MKNILIVVGTRPNFIKVTQFKKVAAKLYKEKCTIKIVHTGQHFDKSMSDLFFKQLDIWPDYFLNISQSSPNTQIGEIMINLEEVILNHFKPDIILVPGDVNSTLAAGLAAHKLGIRFGHIESGLRSYDRTMPEEVNRILVDEISDYFFVTEQSGIDNLLKEGKPKERIFFVGNTMIDTLIAFNEDIASRSNEFQNKEFILMTMHRPATVDNKEGIKNILSLLNKLPSDQLVVFPMHPRTLNNIKRFNLEEEFNSLENLTILKPLDYFSFQNLIHTCKMIITDSGGIQEEATFKQKPCLTLRPNTERPITVEKGSNTLLNFNQEEILSRINEIRSNTYKKGYIPKFWDGKATERILNIVLEQK